MKTELKVLWLIAIWLFLGVAISQAQTAKTISNRAVNEDLILSTTGGNLTLNGSTGAAAFSGVLSASNFASPDWQRKDLGSNVSSTGEMTAITFNNLVVGKIYYYYGVFLLTDATAGVNCNLEVVNGTIGVAVPLAKGRVIDNDASNRQDNQVILSTIFEATSTSLRTNVNTIEAGTTIVAGGTTVGNPPLSYAILVELNHFNAETTKFN